MLAPITATLLFVFLTVTPVLGSTVYSSAGDEYQCASYQSIENFYAGACPQYTRSQDYINYGSVSSTTYNKAPEDYSVAPGDHTLTCRFKSGNFLSDDLLDCKYNGGTGQRLTVADGQSSDCPEIGDTGPQPSKRANVVGRKEESLHKRYERAPAYQCSQDSEDRYFTAAKITSGGTQGSFTTYECVLHDTLFNNDMTCTYNVYGVLTTTGNDAYHCPNQLCNAKSNMRRSIRRGVYKGEDRIQARQVNTTLIRARKSGKSK